MFHSSWGEEERNLRAGWFTVHPVWVSMSKVWASAQSLQALQHPGIYTATWAHFSHHFTLSTKSVQWTLAPVQLAVQTMHLPASVWMLPQRTSAKQTGKWGGFGLLHAELLGSTGTGVGERQWTTSPSNPWVGDKLWGFVWPSCPSPSCQEAWTFRPPAISLGCSSTPESLNFLHALSYAASAWYRVCKGSGWLSHQSAFGICTLTFMQENFWRFKICVFKLRAMCLRAPGGGMLSREMSFLRREVHMFLGPLERAKQFLIWGLCC